MIAPLFSHVPSQPPSGSWHWLASAGHFDDADLLVAVSRCDVTANNWQNARELAAVLLGAEPGEIECDRIRPVCPCEGEAEDPGPHLPDCPWNDPEYGGPPL
jgi:hypothetical protein